MDFSNIIKGQVTQSLVKTLFERMGYRVSRLGVEELFGEVVHMDEEKYHQLHLPMAMRKLPDLLIADHELNSVNLLEVKYRKIFDESSMKELHSELLEQQKFWPNTLVALFIGTPVGEKENFHQDYLRILRPDDILLLSEANPKIWSQLPEVQKIFSKFDWKIADTDLIVPIVRHLKALDF